MKTILALILLASLLACGQGNSDRDSSDVMAEIHRADQHDAQATQTADVSAEAFLAHVRAEPGVQALPSGLLIEFRSRGHNQALPRPTASATVLVHYEGKLPNGQTFDSSFARNEPAQFPLGGVVPGFAEAIEHMRPGDEVLVAFPPELGYGAQGQPPTIPANSALQFRIILLAFQEPGGRLIQAPH